jgi:hypothetical protein
MLVRRKRGRRRWGINAGERGLGTAYACYLTISSCRVRAAREGRDREEMENQEVEKGGAPPSRKCSFGTCVGAEGGGGKYGTSFVPLVDGGTTGGILLTLSPVLGAGYPYGSCAPGWGA